jgi:hypothetical protein
MNAPAIYMVKFWIKPGGEERVFDWLDKGHLADVVRQPGFLWTRRYRLIEPDEEGWPAFAMIYGVESLEALEAYFQSEATACYAKEREDLGLNDLLKMDRNWGTQEFAMDAAS